MEPIVKVTAKTFSRPPSKRGPGIGCREYAYVYGYCFAAVSTARTPASGGAAVPANLFNFIQENRSAMREFKSALALLNSAGEGTTLMTEHLAFEQTGWNRRAVHLY